MRSIITILNVIITIISWLVFCSGIVLTGIGIFELAMVFVHLFSNDHTLSRMSISLLHAVDLFLVAIVFFVMALGFIVLFNSPEKAMPVRLPEWLRVKNFTQLKIILWEAILTTLVVSWVASLAEQKIRGESMGLYSLIIPAGIMLLAFSLFLLKKGENNHKN